MKRYLYPLLLLVALTVQCTQENKSAFDDPASVRATQAVEQAYTTLTTNAYGWKMLYYPDSELYGGYRFLFRFFNNNRVDMAWEANSNVVTSGYRVDLSQGPMLVFTTYNYIHILADPGNAPIPNGLKGDYEFILEEVTAERITMVGRKHGVRVVMERATAEDWDLESVQTLQRAFEVQESESWQVFMNGEKVQGRLNMDILRRNYILFIGSNSVTGTYTLTPNGLAFDQPATIEVEGTGNTFTFNGFNVIWGDSFASRKIVSDDAQSTLVFSIKEIIPVTAENIVTYQPDPDINARDAFMYLMNDNGGTRSMYRLTQTSASVGALVSDLLTTLPLNITDIRFYSPGSATRDLRIWYVIQDGTTSANLYWNNDMPALTDPGNNPLFDVRISNANYTYNPTTWTYTRVTSSAAHVAFRAFIIQATGFTIINDGNVSWFRSIANPNDWFKLEPITL